MAVLSADGKPLCGGESALSDDIKSLLAPLIGIVGTAGALAGLATKLPKAWLEAIGGVLGATGASAALVATLILAYFAIQIGTIAVFGVNWFRKCHKTSGGPICVSGIVNAVHDASIPPLTLRARHPHVDMVVKPLVWPEFERPDFRYVYCSDLGIGGRRSPMVKAFFKSERVCTVLAATFGGSFAAPVVALVAVNGVLGALGAAGLVGAIAFFAFALLLWLAALVAGAIAGAIAAAATDQDTPQAGVIDPENDGDQALPNGYGTTTTIALGDLLTVEGPALSDGNYNNSFVVRFVEQAFAIGSWAHVKNVPYNHADAVEALPPEVDICLPPPRPDPSSGDGDIAPNPPAEIPPEPVPVP